MSQQRDYENTICFIAEHMNNLFTGGAVSYIQNCVPETFTPRTSAFSDVLLQFSEYVSSTFNMNRQDSRHGLLGRES